MSLKITKIAAAMTTAASDSFAEDWDKARDYARPELQRLARSLVDITKLIARKKVSRRQAKALLRIHKNTTLMVLLTIEGLGVIAVENAINAALSAASDAVNAVVGFRLV